jgi:drug/metabolite transporter (DMT)-like permease
VGLAVGMEKALQPGGAQAWTGEAAALGSALVGAGCSVLYRPYLRRYPTLQVSAVAMLASVACLGVAAALGEHVFATGLRLTPSGWIAVAFIGASSGVGYYLWLWALGHTTPTRVTVFLALSPVTAAGLGALLLDEQPSGPALLGLLAVVLGLWLAHLPAPADDSIHGR